MLDALEYDLPAHRQLPPPILSPSSVPPPSDSDEAHADHTFKIVTTQRTLLLCAPSEEDEIKWLGAVRALIARRSGVPGETARTTAVPVAAGHAAASAPVPPSDATSPPSSGFTSGGSGGIKNRVRRLSASASGGQATSGIIIEESANEGQHK